MKFQSMNKPYGMFLHPLGPLEGLRHDWTQYVRSELDEMFSELL